MAANPPTALSSHEAVTRCATALRRQWPEFDTMVKLPPATDEQLAALSTAIGQTLPPVLDAWLRVVNGENIGVVFAAGWTLLSTDEIAMHWGFFANDANQIAPLVQYTDHPHRVVAPGSFARRIPIAADYSGNLLVIDFDPANAAFSGQILLVVRDATGGLHVVFDGFESLLDALSTEIEQGRVDSGDGGVRFTASSGMLRPWHVRARAFREVEWAPSAEQRAFTDVLDAGWRSACYQGQNDLLGTEVFGADDLDLIRTIDLSPELLAQCEHLASFPYLRHVRVNGNATPALFATLAELPIRSLAVIATTPGGLYGMGVMARNVSVAQLTLAQADQAAFDAAATMAGLIELIAINAHVMDVAAVAQLTELVAIQISGTGTPDLSPIYQHPRLRRVSFSVELSPTR
jgi:cell wall assembly regulator SMI1